MATEKPINIDTISDVNGDVMPQPSEFKLAIRELLKRPPALFGVFLFC